MRQSFTQIMRSGIVLAGMLIASCSGNQDIGYDADDLLGVWTMVGDTTPSETTRLSDVEILYAKDGTSTYDALLTISDTPDDDKPIRLKLDGDVRWSLEETVLTRTLQSMTVSPLPSDGESAPSDEAKMLAEGYQAGFSETPPTLLLIETLTDNTFIVLDTATQDRITFERKS